MKKLYSFLLLATALLLSTNVNADIVSLSASSSTELVAAFENAADSAIITLDAGFTLETSIVIQNGKYRKLNVNGKTLSATLTGAYSYQGLFYVVHGTLEIVGSGELINNANASSSVILMSGAGYLLGNDDMPIEEQKMNDRSRYGNFSNLIIGDGQNELRLTTNAMKSGAAVGACIEVYGMANNAITNTIKQSAAGISNEGYVSNYYYKNSQNKFATSNAQHAAYGVTVTVKNNASVYGSKYGIQISGTVATPDTLNRPVINILKGAEVSSDATASESTALYAAGMGEWNVAGEIHGSSGAYVKAGAFNVTEGAVIYSDNPNHRDIENTTSGVVAGGSAIVYESNKAYVGNIKIHISGDCLIGTKEEGMANNAGGFAIEGDQASDANNQVLGIVIEGGTFVSGAEGCFDAAPVIEALNNGENVDIHIFGTTFDNKTESGGVIDLLTAAAGDDYHVAQTTNNAGETVYIITETPSDAEVVPQNTSIDQTDGKKWITWTDHTNSVTIPEASIAYLSLEGSSHLTIPTGKILHVGSVVVTTNSDITVEPGGQLIIDSIGGLVANQTSNLILQTSVANPAIFMMNPSTVANTHPKATVEFIAHTGVIAGGTKAIFQRFGIPFQSSITNVTCDNNDRSRFWSFNMDANTWTSLGYINGNAGDPALNMSALAEPFDYYQLLNYASTDPTADIKYTMTGSLVGNATPSVNVRANFWNGYANSFMGKMLLSELLELIPNTVDKAVYTYDITATKATWEPLSLLNIAGVKLNPMQPFLIRNTAAGADFDIDYAATVYNPAVTPINPAPARRSASDMTMAQINIVGGNSTDYILVAEDAQFSASFDNGYDAAKYMNEGINLYVAAEENMSIYATDNLSNAKVGFAAKEAGEYTLTFSKVSGDNLTLLDRETGARIAMIEGNTYTFDAVANTSNDERFVILSGRHTPTDAEEITAAQKKEGIFTILGEYVGAANAWNSLPAGVYVVNGEKRVK